MAGELVEGFAAQAKCSGCGKFHIAQGLVNAADMLDFHVGQLGEASCERARRDKLRSGIVGRYFTCGRQVSMSRTRPASDWSSVLFFIN